MLKMDSLETEYLIPRQRARRCWSKGKPFLIALLILVLLSSCVIIGLINRCHLKGTCQKYANKHRARGTLPSSFSVTFKIINDNANATTYKSREIEISWDKDDLRYRERNHFHPSLRDARSVSSEGSRLISTLTITGNITTFKFHNIDFNKTACEVRKTTEWYNVVKTMLHDKCDIIPSSECSGKMWKTRMNHQVQFCIEDSRLLFIRYKQYKAKALRWRAPADVDSIPLLLTGAKCHVDSASHKENLKSPLTEDGTHAQPLQVQALNNKQKKTCLFIHGTGNATPKQGYKTLSEFDYWGKIQDYTPQCSSHSFIKFDTVNHGWDEPALHDMFCAFSGSSESNGKLISDKILFSHSFGNLVVAAALKRGVCKIDKATTSWYSVQAPWRGSEAADVVEGVCKCVFGKECHFPFQREMMDFVTDEFHYCSGPAISRSYKTLQTDYKSSSGLTFQDLIETAKAHISGALCGVSAWGMGKHWYRSSLLEFVQLASKMKHPNDGMVSLESCIITGNFKETPESRFYKAHVNHEEGTCRFGERWRPNERPCTWYGKMAQNAISRS